MVGVSLQSVVQLNLTDDRARHGDEPLGHGRHRRRRPGRHPDGRSGGCDWLADAALIGGAGAGVHGPVGVVDGAWLSNLVRSKKNGLPFTVIILHGRFGQAQISGD